MAEICKNIQPISLDEFFKRVGNSSANGIK